MNCVPATHTGNSDIFELSSVFYQKLQTGDTLPENMVIHLKKPDGMKGFFFHEGRIIRVKSKECESPIFAKIRWNDTGTGFTLEKFNPDQRV